MGKRIELAIIFRRNRINEFEEEFIPDKIIEGTYNDFDRCFLDLDDVPYLHIAEPMIAGKGFGCRLVIEEGEKKLTDEIIENLKKFFLDEANKYIYLRNRQESYYIIQKNKENNDVKIFEDDETTEIYSLYQEEYRELHRESEGIEQEIKMLPSEINTKIKETIKGQDAAIEKIVTSLWVTKKFKEMTKKNMLVIGPTGVGKTAIFRKLEKILELPLTIFSVPGLSQAGYVGRSTDEILKQIYFNSEEDIDLAENSIVILDEIDKLAYTGSDSGSVSTAGVQNELLKMIEGEERIVEINQAGEAFAIDTSKIIFVCTGAFSELYEKPKPSIGFGNSNEEQKKSKINTEALIKYGMKRELLGRLPVVIELNSLTEEILKDIILNSDESEFQSTIKAIESLGVTIKNKDEIVDLIVKDALSKGIGARGLISTISNIFLKIFYEIANNQGLYKEVVIGENILNDIADFKLIPKEVKRRTKNIKGI